MVSMRRLAIYFLIFLFSACGSSTSSYEYSIAFDPTWRTLDVGGREIPLRAFTMDVIQEVAKHEKLNIRLFERGWNSLMPALQNEDCDAILTTMQPYLFYEKLYDFSDIYLATGPTLVVLASSDVQSLEQMDGSIIGIQRDSSSALILEKYSGIIQRSYDTVPQALLDVTTGKIDGAMVDILTAHAFCNDLFQGQLKIVMPPLSNEGIRLVTLHDRAPRLIEAFNHALKKMQSDGTYAELTKKWNLSES